MSMSNDRGGRGSRLGDEFDRADISDHELDVAADHELRAVDADDLIGDWFRPRSLSAWADEWARAKREANREVGL